MAVLPSAPASGIQFLDSRFRRPLHNLVSPVSGAQTVAGTPSARWWGRSRHRAAEPPDGEVVRSVVLQTQSHKAAEGKPVAQGFFQLGGGEVIPLR